MADKFTEGLPLLDTIKVNGALQTAPFLSVCGLVADVVGNMGTGLVFVKSDINGNMQRLKRKLDQDPQKFSQLFSIIEDEVAHGNPSASSSCTKGLLWLKRAMEFATALLHKLITQPAEPMSALVKAAYDETLYRFHGYLTYGVFSVAMSFVPTRESFLEALNNGSSTEVPMNMPVFVARFQQVLQEVHNYLDTNGLNDPATA